jgi:predicted nuclease of restriction endonuclease-like (RecB) superfamily
MTREIAQTSDYRDFIRSLKQKVQSAQIKAARAVNTQLIELYWDLGKLITEKQQEAGWGDAVIDQVARDLTRELDGVKGFSRRNLYYMQRFYGFYQEQDEFVQQLVAQIPWGHNIEIFQKVKEPDKALWYVRKTLENNWSRNVLAHQLDSQLFERQGAKTGIDNFSECLPVPDSDLARESLKDPYVFDFLGLGEEARERALEDALIEHLTRFMLELGKGFAFVGRQYHLEVGEQDFYIDLLFYHLKLHCYVVIELKSGPFKPEYAGKLNFYLTAVDEQVKAPEDSPSIGLLLCRDRDNLVAEYALRDLNKPIGVSRYELSSTLPEGLKTSLPTLEEVEQGLSDESRQESEE